MSSVTGILETEHESQAMKIAPVSDTVVSSEKCFLFFFFSKNKEQICNKTNKRTNKNQCRQTYQMCSAYNESLNFKDPFRFFISEQVPLALSLHTYSMVCRTNCISTSDSSSDLVASSLHPRQFNLYLWRSSPCLKTLFLLSVQWSASSYPPSQVYC